MHSPITSTTFSLLTLVATISTGCDTAHPSDELDERYGQCIECEDLLDEALDSDAPDDETWTDEPLASDDFITQEEKEVIDDATEAQQGNDLDIISESTQAANCNGAACNGQDPVVSGCDIGATTLKTVKKGILWPIYVDQRFSPTCNTRWSRFRSNVGQPTTATIIRNDGLTYSFYHNGTLNYSDMVYCPRNTCAANAKVTAGTSTIQTGNIW